MIEEIPPGFDRAEGGAANGADHPYRGAAQGLCRGQGTRGWPWTTSTFKWEKGEFCCIVGQSGSGKSTLLNQLAGLEKPTKGQVFIGKHEISAMTENELASFRQAHLGFIFQSYNLLPSMTAAENVALPPDVQGDGAAQAAGAGPPGTEKHGPGQPDEPPAPPR